MEEKLPLDDAFVECFSDLEDPRVDRTKKHLLLDVIAISLCGVLSGAQGWEEIEDFGNLHKDWLSTFLSLPNDIPSHDTISRVFAALDTTAFQECTLNWLQRIRTLLPETVIPLDGKTLRRSGCKKQCQKAFHIINAWSCANQISLGQLKVDGKSNEIPAVPELLNQLHISGAIVTLDAMGCQEKTVKQICDAGADYVIGLKGNQGNLHELVKDAFVASDEGSKNLVANTVNDEIDGDHGRIDMRSISVISAASLGDLIDSKWKNLNSIIRITYNSESHEKSFSGERFYISSLPPYDPLNILKAIKEHWQVENCLHWSLDVTFREDYSRIRDENAAINMSWMRKFALGLLKNEKTFKKGSIRRKQLKAWADPSYFNKIFAVA